MKTFNTNILADSFLLHDRDCAITNTQELHDHLQDTHVKEGLHWLTEAVSDYNRGRGYNSFKYNLSDAMKSIDAHYWNELLELIDYESLVPKAVYKKFKTHIDEKKTAKFTTDAIAYLFDEIERDLEKNITQKVSELYDVAYGYKPKPNSKGFMKTMIFGAGSLNDNEKFVELLHNIAVVLNLKGDTYKQASVSLFYSINRTGEWLSFYNGLFEAKLHSDTYHIKVNPIVAKLLNDELHKSEKYDIDEKYLTGDSKEVFDTSGEFMFNSNINYLLSIARDNQEVKTLKIPYDSDEKVTIQLEKIIKKLGGTIDGKVASFENDITEQALQLGCNHMI